MYNNRAIEKEVIFMSRTPKTQDIGRWVRPDADESLKLDMLKK